MKFLFFVLALSIADSTSCATCDSPDQTYSLTGTYKNRTLEKIIFTENGIEVSYKEGVDSESEQSSMYDFNENDFQFMLDGSRKDTGKLIFGKNDQVRAVHIRITIKILDFL